MSTLAEKLEALIRWVKTHCEWTRGNQYVILPVELFARIRALLADNAKEGKLDRLDAAERQEMSGFGVSVEELLDESLLHELAIDNTSNVQGAFARICSLLQEKSATLARPSPADPDGLREIQHVVENIRKGHPYLDPLEILCAAVERIFLASPRKEGEE
jgi:hypothetical protein